MNDFIYLLLIAGIIAGGGYYFKSINQKTQQSQDHSEVVSPVRGAESASHSFEPEMVLVRGGCYQMGCGGWTDSCKSDEEPVHEVCVDDFYMGIYEVTQGEWKWIMGNNPSEFRNCGNNCPVEAVSWNDVHEYIRKLNETTGKKYRLPTEAEWEYACRSRGKAEKYSGGGIVESVAWYKSNSGNRTHPVGQKKPNGLGIYDMNGNVWEWVQDWYDGGYYKNSPRNNPAGPDSGSRRCVRGGSWFNYPGMERCGNRINFSPTSRGFVMGVRLLHPVK